MNFADAKALIINAQLLYTMKIEWSVFNFHGMTLP
jgi:hypothetical protein